MIRAKHSRRAVGRAVLDAVAAARDLRRVLARSVSGAVRGRADRRAVVGQMYQVGNRSLIFVIVTLGFIGMVLVFQTCLQVSHISGDLSQVGQDWARILVQEFGPTLTGVMIAIRVGAGIAAEVGSMVVTEQVYALRMSGVDPIDYLIVPRLWACVIMGLVVTVIAVVVAMASGVLTAHLAFGVNPRTFLDLSGVGGADVVLGVIKCLAYGAAIPVVAGWCGLCARGGSEGVGTATTRAVIGANLAVIVLDFFISAAGYVLLSANPGA